VGDVSVRYGVVRPTRIAVPAGTQARAILFGLEPAAAAAVPVRPATVPVRPATVRARDDGRARGGRPARIAVLAGPSDVVARSGITAPSAITARSGITAPSSVVPATGVTAASTDARATCSPP